MTGVQTCALPILRLLLCGTSIRFEHNKLAAMLLTFIALRWTWPLLLFLKGIDDARKSTVSYTENTQSQRHLHNTKKRGPNCREGKILDLSQTDTSYYQVHKIQPIIKHRVLLLDFAITTQKPTEICQVSCKKPITHQCICKR